MLEPQVQHLHCVHIQADWLSDKYTHGGLHIIAIGLLACMQLNQCSLEKKACTGDFSAPWYQAMLWHLPSTQ